MTARVPPGSAEDPTPDSAAGSSSARGPSPPPSDSPSAPWARASLHVFGLGWGTYEIVLGGGRYGVLGFVALVLLGVEGVRAAQKVTDLLR